MVKRCLLTGLVAGFLSISSTLYAGESEIILKDNTTASGLTVKEETANTTIARFRGDGNVGIGTTSPNNKLTVAGGNVSVLNNGGDPFIEVGDIAGTTLLAKWNSAGHYGFLQTQIGDTWGGNLVLQPNSGNVGIGTTSPGAPLEVKNISAANAQILWLTKPQTGGGGAADQGGYLLFGGGATGSTVRGYFGFTQASGGIQTILTGASNDAIALRAEGALQFGTGGDNIRMTVLSTGNVGIGTTSPQHPLHMGSGAHVTVAGVWTNASSREYKENIRDLTADEAMQTLDGLRPTRFNYKVDKDDEYVGFIAEDVPDLVATRDRKGLSPMDLTAVLTKAVQEQQRMLQDQKETIDAMKQEIEILKSGRNSGVKGL